MDVLLRKIPLPNKITKSNKVKTAINPKIFGNIFKYENKGVKGDKMPWWLLVLKIIFGIILVLVIGGTGLFGYIAWKARARKWSGGMFAIAIVSVFLLYWLILGDPFEVVPFTLGYYFL